MKKAGKAAALDEQALDDVRNASNQYREAGAGLDSAVTVDLSRYLGELEEMKKFLKELKEKTAFPEDAEARLELKKKKAEEVCRDLGYRY